MVEVGEVECGRGELVRRYKVRERGEIFGRYMWVSFWDVLDEDKNWKI